MPLQENGCTLSLCMIVKNEENCLSGCLESVSDVVDEIVVVDTGSNDRTVETARQFGAQVYHFKWCDDFSAARNESIKHATGDWILWMDADEQLLAESQPKLKKLLTLENKPIIYRVYIRNIVRRGEYHTISSAHRLFNNHMGIYFTGRIHEQVSPSAAKLKGEERDSQVHLYHTGYSLEGEKAANKNRRNRRLLEKMVKDAPNSAYAHYTLAQHYGLTGNPAKALAHSKIAYDLKQFDPPMTAALLNAMSEALLKLHRLEDARKRCRESIRMRPVQAGGYYMLYKIAVAEGKDEEAIDWLKQLLSGTDKLRQGKKSLSTDVLIDEHRILFTMGGLYGRIGKFDEAVDCLERVYQHNPNNIRLLEQLAENCARRGDFDAANKYLKHLIDLGGGDLRHVESLGTILIRQRKFREAITVYESILSRIPRDENVLRRLIGLYGKLGDMQKAEELLTDLRSMVSSEDVS